MAKYLEKPLTVGQSNRLLKFLMVLRNLDLVTETTFEDSAYIFDDYIWEHHQLSWEVPPLEWFNR
jgi:hypothetical protein